MNKNYFLLTIISIFILSSAGCSQAENTETQEENPVKISLKGKISNTPAQHLIDIKNEYPYIDYFDSDKGQYVIYSKEKIVCKDDVSINGQIVNAEGTSKRPGSDEVYKEQQILVDTFKCEKPEETIAKIISNEFPTKIVYVNDLASSDKMKADCAERGGTFNTCGSPCSPDAELCIEVCAYTCELGDLTSTGSTLTNTENWLTYSNKDLGFSIKYPSTLNKKEGEGSPIAFSVWGPTQLPETEFYDGINISFYKEPYEGAQSFEAFINSQLEVEKEMAESVSELYPVTIGDKSGYRADIVSLGPYTNYYIPLDASYYLLINVMAPDPTGQGYAATVNSMLESITFETAT